jgi:hypothetical protein
MRVAEGTRFGERTGNRISLLLDLVCDSGASTKLATTCAASISIRVGSFLT